MQLQNLLPPRVYLLKKHNAAAKRVLIKSLSAKKKHNAAAKLALITKSLNAKFATLCAYRRIITPYRHACIASSDQKQTKTS